MKRILFLALSLACSAANAVGLVGWYFLPDLGRRVDFFDSPNNCQAGNLAIYNFGVKDEPQLNIFGCWREVDGKLVIEWPDDKRIAGWKPELTLGDLRKPEWRRGDPKDRNSI